MFVCSLARSLGRLVCLEIVCLLLNDVKLCENCEERAHFASFVQNEEENECVWERWGEGRAPSAVIWVSFSVHFIFVCNVFHCIIQYIPWRTVSLSLWINEGEPQPEKQQTNKKATEPEHTPISNERENETHPPFWVCEHVP